MHRTEAKLKLESPYDTQLGGILLFASFADAEGTILRLEKLRQGYLAAGDKKGIGYCRQLARLGRRRAVLIGRNMRVGIRKRLQKREIANWFQVWLETPELFQDWLALRKATIEFRRLSESDSAVLNETGSH